MADARQSQCDASLLSADAHGTARLAPGRFRGRARARARGKALRQSARARRVVRPRRGRRRDQRPGVRVLLSQAPPRRRADPGPRQPRRLRRPREAQRVPPGRADAPRLGGTVNLEYPEVQRGRERADPRARHRHPAPAQGLRVQLAGHAERPAVRAPLQRGALRPRRAAARRDPRRPRAGRARAARRLISVAGRRARETQGLPAGGPRRARGQDRSSRARGLAARYSLHRLSP